MAVGHVTLDETARGRRPGGAALYAAVTAHRLGCSVGVLTSFGDDFPAAVIPPEIQVARAPSATTTRFRHEFRRGERRLTLLGRAAGLTSAHLPEGWAAAGLVLLCPVADEVDPSLAGAFPDAAVGAAIQGWMRQRGVGGVMKPARWTEASTVTPHLQAIFLSREDMGAFEKDVIEWMQMVPVGVVTLGRSGAVLFVNGERYPVEVDPAEEKDATGAGDVFAAAFMIEYQREGNPWDAAAFAACAAACSVEVEGIEGIPDPETLNARVARYRSRLAGEMP